MGGGRGFGVEKLLGVVERRALEPFCKGHGVVVHDGPDGATELKTRILDIKRPKRGNVFDRPGVKVGIGSQTHGPSDDLRLFEKRTSCSTRAARSRVSTTVPYFSLNKPLEPVYPAARNRPQKNLPQNSPGSPLTPAQVRTQYTLPMFRRRASTSNTEGERKPPDLKQLQRLLRLHPALPDTARRRRAFGEHRQRARFRVSGAGGAAVQHGLWVGVVSRLKTSTKSRSCSSESQCCRRCSTTCAFTT